MESTPGLDDLALTPGGPTHYAPSSSVQPSEQQSGAAPTQSAAGHQKFSNGPHIRSRITVVCAECKRLKLKCDRRTPCSSCLKRDTVQRCVYSQAAAEKVDVQTLHNRIIEIERALAQLQAAPPSTPVSAVLSGIPTFKQPNAVAGPSRAGPSLANSNPATLAGLPCNDRALLAQGASGSSVVISLEDVVSLWLGELEDGGADSRSSRIDTASGSMRPSASTTTVKLEPTPVSIPSPSSSFTPGHGSHIGTGGAHALHPPAPYDAFLPPPSAGPSALPQVTSALIAYLPAEPARSRYLKAFRETMHLHPSINVPHFEQRIAAIYTWAENGETATPIPAYGNKPMSKQDLARDLFFPANKPGSSSRTNGTGSGNGSNAPKPTLSFFSAACAAFALGSLVARDEDPDPSQPSPTSPSAGGDASGTPAMLFALSEQAMQLFEKTAAYDLDSVVAMILQVLYMLHEGQMSVAQGVFPLVGKMVNVARMMGLAIDPDEFPGTYNLFEAETRRRIWWEVFYFDLFVADSMGHPPLIADNTHTTRLPADVEEDKFTPSCMSLPVPDGLEGDSTSSYFALKCKLAQLVKNVKKQTFRDPLSENADLSIDQAGTFEGDVATFLQELPASFKLEMTQDIAKPIPAFVGSPFRLAQQCELTILANRLIVKLYLPFLKEAAATNKPSHQAVFGTISAAHNIVYASRLLHTVWGQTRPAVFDFYDFGRTLFDAGVVCAHAVIQEPLSIVAAEGLKNVTCTLETLRELGTSRHGVEGARTDKSSRTEAIKILEVMKRKAEAARSGGASAGTKRKHSEIEGEPSLTSAAGGFQLPFVGAAVSSSKPERAPRAGGARPADGKSAKPDAKKQAKEKDRDREREKDKDKEKDKEKEKDGGAKEKEKSSAGKYLNGPLRVRPMTGQPAPRRPRTASVSTAAGATPAPPSVPLPAVTAPSTNKNAPTAAQRNAPPPQSPLTTTPPGGLPTANSTSQIPPSSARTSISIPESPSAPATYEPYVPPRTAESMHPPPPQQHSPHQQQQQQQQQEEFAMQYGSSPPDDDRRFSSYDSPQSAGMYESQYASPATAYAPPHAQIPPQSQGPPPPPPSQQQQQAQAQQGQGYYMYAPGPGPYDMGMMDPYGQPPPQHHPQHQYQQQQPHPQHPQHPQHAQAPQHPQHPHQPPMAVLGWPQDDPAAAGGDLWNYKFYS